MIGSITGLLLEKQPPLVLIDVNGIGYEVDVPMSTFCKLPAIGEKVTLRTHCWIREDAQLLFGFMTESERALFRQLTKISGIGAKTGLAILSGLSVNDLQQIVLSQDVVRLTKIPGIGKKTAERVVVDLSDKVGLPTSYGRANDPVQTELNVNDEALEALMALGYTLADAMKALEGVDVKLPTNQRVTQALRGV